MEEPFFLIGAILFSKQITVCSGTGQCQYQDIILDAVYQKPVRQNMAFSVPDLIPCQRMITIFLRQRFPRGIDF